MMNDPLHSGNGIYSISQATEEERIIFSISQATTEGGENVQCNIDSCVVSGVEWVGSGVKRMASCV